MSGFVEVVLDVEADVGGDWKVTLWRDQRVERGKVELASNGELGAQPFVTDPYMGRLRYPLYKCCFLRTKMLTLDIYEIKKSEERLSLLRRTAEPEIGGKTKKKTDKKN